MYPLVGVKLRGFGSFFCTIATSTVVLVFLYFDVFIYSYQVWPSGDPTTRDSPATRRGRHVEAPRAGAVPPLQCRGNERANRGLSSPGAVHGLRRPHGQLPPLRRAHREGGKDLQHVAYSENTLVTRVHLFGTPKTTVHGSA